MTQAHYDDPVAADPRAGRVLLFSLDDQPHAIRVAEVCGVVSCESLRVVPGSPAAVLGLAEWRGSVLTVLDLPGLLGRGSPAAAACLIRLAPPLEQTALYLPSTLWLTEHRLECVPAEANEGEGPVWLCGGDVVRLVEPSELVHQVEREMRET